MASPPPRPSLSPLKRPAAADEASSAGAAEFVRYWYAELDRAYEVLDGRIIDALSENRCSACTNYVEDIRGSAKRGERFVGGTYRVTSAVAPAVVDGITVVLVKYDADELVIRAKTGEVIERFSAEKGVTSQVQVMRKDGSWTVRALRDVR